MLIHTSNKILYDFDLRHEIKCFYYSVKSMVIAAYN